MTDGKPGSWMRRRAARRVAIVALVLIGCFEVVPHDRSDLQAGPLDVRNAKLRPADALPPYASPEHGGSGDLQTSSSMLAGQTFYGRRNGETRLTVRFRKDGTLAGVRVGWPGPNSDSGVWWIRTGGETCRRWRRWDTARSRCVAANDALETVAALFDGRTRNLQWIRRSTAKRTDARPVSAGTDPPPHAQISDAASPPFGAGVGEAAVYPVLREAEYPVEAYHAKQTSPPPLTVAADALLNNAFDTEMWGLRQVVGYAASAMVLLTFCVREMLTLRCLAILSNVAFMVYGYVALLPPVFLLHALLLPINAARLLQLLASEPDQRAGPTAAPNKDGPEMRRIRAFANRR